MHKRIVHIVDDDDALRRTLVRTLVAGGYDCRDYASGAAFLDQLDGVELGCVLLDLRMPGVDGLTVLRALAERRPELPAIMLTGSAGVPDAVLAMKSGAVDFLQKPYERATLRQAIASAFERMEQAETSRRREREATARLAKLSPREREVLLRLAKGAQQKIVAHELGISQRTVEVHCTGIRQKLGVKNLAEALQIAFEGGLRTANGAAPHKR